MNKLDIRNLHLADFGHNLNKMRQTLSDVILQEGDGPTVIPTLAKKITSELAEVRVNAIQCHSIRNRCSCQSFTYEHIAII